ncbi:GTP 3',8-cyclase MoaA [Fodinisporobacter ferrooxydans]|uniref:GTP 3',8-cyclase n=1 Tax=Fodinisporobacter ferrooxydans TaxID=2901836 RepID=A0ABY4CSF8_9BACL|nr:GTP 3',8-cyclase MoaA [Alicyclobacillaceae bacterium MYW30-H2]
MESLLKDRFGRIHDYLRISVTDRCNLRCVYCMPAEGLQWMENKKILSYEEISYVVEVAAKLGVRKLRITGGEPLVRKDLTKLIAKLSKIPGIEDIALTTNGILLEALAEPLRAAGVTRINISIDSLKDARFAEITRGGDLQKVLRGLEAAVRVGMQPIKINTVLMKQNLDEIPDFIRLIETHPYHIRFIEYMPIGHADDAWRDAYTPLSQVRESIEQMGFQQRESTFAGNGPAEYFHKDGYSGSIGFIHPVSDHFCANCNRLRLTADGFLKPCLYWSYEYNVRNFIGDEDGMKRLLFDALGIKPESHEMAKQLLQQELGHMPTDRRMSQIGG